MSINSDLTIWWCRLEVAEKLKIKDSIIKLVYKNTSPANSEVNNWWGGFSVVEKILIKDIVSMLNDKKANVGITQKYIEALRKTTLAR